jgi:hypothetical protein
LNSRLNRVTLAERSLQAVCGNCAGQPQRSELYAKGALLGADCCESIDCPVFFERCRLVGRIEDCTEAVKALEKDYL